MTSEQLSVVGVNFRKTSLEIRSKFALTPEHAKSIYLDANEQIHGNFFILSTCNRTEIYATGIPTELLVDLLSKHSGLSSIDVRHYAFTKSGDAAVQHIFRVASGLDSQILGDYEIIGQIKKAFALARSCNKANGFLEKLVNAALQVSKQIKSETSISNGTTSVSYAVIQLLKQMVGNDGSLNICLVGLGKIGILTLKNLKHYLPNSQITLINRNESKAEMVALNEEVAHAPFSELKNVMSKSHVLIVATGADRAIVSKTDIELTPVKLIFDLAVPSNVNTDVIELKDIQLYNIDQLSQIINQAVEVRKNEIPLAEGIITEHLNAFRQWEIRRGLFSTKLSSHPNAA